MWRAPFPRMRLYTKPAMYAAVAADILLGRAGRPDEVDALETAVCRAMGARHAVAMPQARVGIYLAVRRLVRPGRKVVLSPYTIVDVINMVICAGAVPVFADIARDTCNLDADRVEECLADPEVDAVMVTHFYGLACDVERIRDLCESRGVALIEDAAQAFGCQVNGRTVGTFGQAGILSFGLYKNVTGFLGGMVVTDDDDMATSLRAAISDWPVQPLKPLAAKVIKGLLTDIATWPLLFRALTYWIFRAGHLYGIEALNNQLRIDANPQITRQLPKDYQARLSPLQARLVRGQLPGLRSDIAARIATAQRYAAGLADISELILPPLRTDGSHVYPYYPIQCERQEELLTDLMRHCRDIAASHHRNCAGLECFAEYAADCPNAKLNEHSCIFLPTYPSYGNEQVDATIASIRRFFGKDA